MRPIESWLNTAFMVTLGVVAVFLANVFGWSSLLATAAFMGSIALGALLLALVTVIRMRWLRRFQKIARRLKRGEGQAVLDEFAARREAGDNSPEVALALSAAYSYLGRGEAAEPLAREVIDYWEQRGAFRKTDMFSKAWCDLALIARSDAWIAQGRYTKAANSLRPRVSSAGLPNFMTAIIAWQFFLAGENYNAQVVLAQLQPMADRRNNKRVVSLEFQFMVYYMRYKLLGEDCRADLARLHDQIAEWENSATRNAANPYGLRLREILDDVRKITG